MMIWVFLCLFQGQQQQQLSFHGIPLVMGLKSEGNLDQVGKPSRCSVSFLKKETTAARHKLTTANKRFGGSALKTMLRLTMALSLSQSVAAVGATAHQKGDFHTQFWKDVPATESDAERLKDSQNDEVPLETIEKLKQTFFPRAHAGKYYCCKYSHIQHAIDHDQNQNSDSSLIWENDIAKKVFGNDSMCVYVCQGTATESASATAVIANNAGATKKQVVATNLPLHFDDHLRPKNDHCPNTLAMLSHSEMVNPSWGGGHAEFCDGNTHPYRNGHRTGYRENPWEHCRNRAKEEDRDRANKHDVNEQRQEQAI